MCFAPKRRALFRDLNFQKWSEPLVFCTFWLGNVLRNTTACTFSRSELPKVVRTPGVLHILTWKCASRHNGVHFFDISTSKSAPRPSVFNTFYFQMFFAPQRVISTSKTAPNPSVFNTFYFQMCFAHLRATTPCTLSTSQLPKVVRRWGVLYLFTSKSASRHNGVHFFDIATSKTGPKVRCFLAFSLTVLRATMHFFISHLARWLRTRRFSEPTFRPSGATNHWKKTQCFATFLPFRAPASSFFWSFLLWLFSLLTAFSSLHIVGSLTSKLPSINYI